VSGRRSRDATGVRRLEREARARRERARAHLERRRSRRRRRRERAREQGRRPVSLPAPSAPVRRALAGGAAALALLAGAALGLGPPSGPGAPAARVTAIAVQGHRHLTAEAVAGATGLERGAPLRGLDAAAVEERLARHPWIRAARVGTAPRGRLLVRVEERRPVAVWEPPAQAGPARLVDAEGVAFAPASEAREGGPWPRLRGGASPSAQDLARAVALAGLAAERGVPAPVSVWLPDPERPERGWSLSPRDLPLRAVLGREGDRFPERLGRLALLLDEDPLRARRAARIDLRFAGRAFLSFAGEGATAEGPSRKGPGTSGGA